MSKYKQLRISKRELREFEEEMHEDNIDTLDFKTIEELRSDFDMEEVLLYFASGRLLSWLDDHFYEEEAEAVEQLSEDDPNLCDKLCNILGVDPAEYVESVSLRNEQIEQLGKYTDNPADYVDATAFDQEELASLLKDGADTIYLCDNTFTIPLRKKGKTYVGFGNAIVLIRRDGAIDLDGLGITFRNLQIESNAGIISTNKTPEELFKLGDEADRACGHYQSKLEEAINYGASEQDCNELKKLANQAANDAFKYYKLAAEAGNTEAMFCFARFHDFGIGTEKNPQTAIHWYETAANNGHVESMTELGNMYSGVWRSGIKVPKDLQQAIHWYEIAAQAGDLWAMNQLGNIYYDGGDGVEKDHAKAFQFFNKVAKSGINKNLKNLNDVWSIRLRETMIKLAGMYKVGDGVGKDYLQAQYWYEKSGYAEEMRQKYGDKSGCFITTAVCENFGKPDDCFELTTFRNFRDGWLTAQSNGKSLIAEYYAIAPRIVANINRAANPAKIYETIREKYLEPCLHFILRGDNLSCKNKYVEMVTELKKIYS